MKRHTIDLFEGLPERCTDDEECRRLLITFLERLRTIKKPLYAPLVKDGGRYQFIHEFYYELLYRNYARAYETLRYMDGFINLCSSEMVDILSTTISSLTEE